MACADFVGHPFLGRLVSMFYLFLFFLGGSVGVFVGHVCFLFLRCSTFRWRVLFFWGGIIRLKGGGDGPVLGATFKRLSVLLFSCSWSATFLVFTFFDLRM